MEPQGTPALTMQGAERAPGRRTEKVRFLRKLAMICERYNGVPKLRNLKINPGCQTVSKAFATSRKTAAVCL